MSRVLQEGKSGQGILAFMVAKDHGTGVMPVERRKAERKGTVLEGLRTDEETVQRVVTLLAYGCPLQAIVHAFGLDERTVAAWQKRVGIHCKHIHEDMVQQGNVKSQHIQADEIRAKGRNIMVWIALAMDVTTRLWLAGAVSEHRDRTLIDLLLQRTRACCQLVQGLLFCTDGLATYPKSILRAFRKKVKKHSGRGRCCLEIWPDVCIATIIKHTREKAGSRNNAQIDEGNRGEGKRAFASDKRMYRIQYGFY